MFKKKKPEAELTECISPNETYPALQLSISPVRIAPHPRAWLPLSFGEQPERAFAAAFIRLCAEAGEWKGLLRADVLERLHDEAARGRQALPCIPGASLLEELPLVRDRQVRTFMYLYGRAVCVRRGLLKAELVQGWEVLRATERLIWAIGEPEYPEGVRLIELEELC